MNIEPRLHRTIAAQPYPLLLAIIGGAHLYGLGFPSPPPDGGPQCRRALRASWSDFDLRGAHVLPLEKVVELDGRDETIE